jgi:hypothetical protein
MGVMNEYRRESCEQHGCSKRSAPQTGYWRYSPYHPAGARFFRVRKTTLEHAKQPPAEHHHDGQFRYGAIGTIQKERHHPGQDDEYGENAISEKGRRPHGDPGLSPGNGRKRRAVPECGKQDNEERYTRDNPSARFEGIASQVFLLEQIRQPQGVQNQRAQHSAAAHTGTNHGKEGKHDHCKNVGGFHKQNSCVSTVNAR